MTAARAHAAASRMARACLGIRTLRVGRRVARIYDQALAPHGLTGARFSILVAVTLVPGVRPADLVDELDLEKSTVSRSIARMTDAGLLSIATRGREQHLTVTEAGEAALLGARPAWARAQKTAAAALGPLADALLARFP